MTKKTLLIVGSLLLIVALAAGQGPRLSERLHPGFSRDAAHAKIGMRVQSLPQPGNTGLVKCPLMEGHCLICRGGEQGTIIETQRVAPNRYFLVVRWDEGAQDGTALYSYLGTYAFRISVKPAE
ncbi:MAG TPA: hypothetical protein VKE93_19895 [Candidatus Angelobacter sp.]|nr:hypothetical protein [Candidatus Angelobacter sp.]